MATPGRDNHDTCNRNAVQPCMWDDRVYMYIVRNLTAIPSTPMATAKCMEYGHN